MLKSFHTVDRIEVGIDEVGRGCFAGPIVAAAVIMPTNFYSELIRDSKKLTEKQREAAFNIILENAIAYSIRAGSVKEINKYGIEKATYLAIERCLYDIYNIHEFDHIIMDGNRFNNPMPTIPYTTIVKGDDKYISIASASILAKVKRDNYMKMLHEHYPDYNFKNNKGYFCKKHGEALLEQGKPPYHRDKYVETWLKKIEKNLGN